MKTQLAQPAGRVDLLDYARFVAAMAVVLYHYTYYGIVSNDIPSIGLTPYLSEISKYGYLGVEFFFMISGYVIFYSAQNSKASSFAVARLLRLYPAFLCAMLVTSITILLWGMQQFKPYASQFLFNLTMVPRAFGRTPIDGSYWTLALEIQFYALIFFFLLLRLGKQLDIFFMTWPILILVASSIGGKDWPIFGGHYSYFAVGALFAMKRIRTNWFINSLILLCLYQSLHFSTNPHAKQEDFTHFSTMTISLVILGFYLFFWALTKEKLCTLSLPKARFAGAITYPLYLIHQVIGYIVISRFANEQNKLLIISGTILFFLILAFLMNKYIEREFKYFWRNLFEKIVGAPIRRVELQILRLSPEPKMVG